jgi:hypothetical protein
VSVLLDAFALVALLAEEPRSESCVAENVQQEAVAAKRV